MAEARSTTKGWLIKPSDIVILLLAVPTRESITSITFVITGVGTSGDHGLSGGILKKNIKHI